MTDTSFDEFFNDKLKDHAASVPAGLWDKVKDTQMDAHINDKLNDFIAPVPAGLWEKITDTQFDNTLADKLYNHSSPLPDNLWEKITDGQLDDFVAGKLTSHSAPVPDGLWEKVKPEEKDDRKGFILFRYPVAAILLLALLLGGSFAAYQFLNGNDTPKISEQALPEKSQPPSALPEINPNNTKGEAKPSGNVKPLEAEMLNKQTSPSTNTNGINTEKEDLTSLAGNSKHKPASSDLQGFKTPQPGSPDKNTSLPVYTDPFNTVHNGQFSASEKAGIPDNEATESADYYQHNRLTAFTIAGNLNRYSLSQGMVDKKLLGNNHTNQFRNVIICPPVRGGLNSDWYVETYLSPDIAFKSVTNNTASQQFLARKDSSESMRVGFSAGVRLVKPLTENILLKAGLQYSQINEKYVYRTENEVKTTTVVSVRTIIRAPGDTVIVRDTSILMQVGYKNNTVKNRFRSLDIPITIGYQFGNEDLRFGINAGVIVNLSSWYQGVILDSSLATVPLAKDNSSMIYKSNIGLGLYGGISIVKKLSDDLHIFAEPYFRYNLSDMTNPQASYKQRFSLGGISLGLRFNLNRY